MSAGSRGADDGLHELAIRDCAILHAAFCGVNCSFTTHQHAQTKLPPGAEPQSYKLGGRLRLPAVCARSSTPILWFLTDSMIGPTIGSCGWVTSPNSSPRRGRPPRPADRSYVHLCDPAAVWIRYALVCTVHCHAIRSYNQSYRNTRTGQSRAPLQCQVKSCLEVT